MSDESVQSAEGAGDVPEVWACVEIFGHRRHYGRVTEVKRFGTEMLRIDVPCAADAFDTFFYGGAAIFSFTPMTEEAARKWAERERPYPSRPISALPPPQSDEAELDEFLDEER